MINFGILGFGHIGKRHAHFIQENKDARLVGVYDNNPEVMQSISTMDVKKYQNYQAMLSDKSLDVICICTPNFLHAEQSIEALQNDFHVLCEKPMCMSKDEADQMIDASKKSGKTIFAVMQNRYNAPVDWVKKIMDEGNLGPVFTASIQCYWNRNREYYEQSMWRGDRVMDGGCLYTQFSHFVDIMYYLLGDVDVLAGDIQNDNHPYINTEDSGTFYLKSKKGNTHIAFQYSTCAYEENMQGSLSLIAQNGSIRIGGKYLNKLEYARVKDTDIPENLEDESGNNSYASGYEGSMSHHDYVIQNVVDSLQGKSKPMTTAEEARDVVAIIQRMYGEL